MQNVVQGNAVDGRIAANVKMTNLWFRAKRIDSPRRRRVDSLSINVIGVKLFPGRWTTR
jgi:hypothetical protein